MSVATYYAHTHMHTQIRKLEFLLADAIDQGCDCVVTIGGYLSNHVRATVMAAKEMGLQSHVLILNMGTEVGVVCSLSELQICH